MLDPQAMQCLPSNLRLARLQHILTATWDDGGDNTRVMEAANKLLDDITDAAKAARIFNRFIDLNHTNEGQNAIAGYGRKGLGATSSCEKEV